VTLNTEEIEKQVVSHLCHVC